MRAEASEVGRPLRLAVFASHPTQYQAPVFRELAKRDDIHLLVLYGSDHGSAAAYDSGFGRNVKWDIPLLEGYDFEILDNRARKKNVNTFLGISVPDVGERFARSTCDAALIMGWQTRGHAQAIRAAVTHGIPTLLFGESTLAMRPTSKWRARIRAAAWLPLRRRAYRFLFSRVDGFLTLGTRNEAYYSHFDVPAEKMFRVGYAVENERFELSESDKTIARTSVRTALGIMDSSFVFVSVAKIQEKKRPIDLLKAFSTVSGILPAARLVYVGDGPQRRELEAEIVSRGMSDRVTLAGFVNQEMIPQFYAAADCAVLPSDSGETWGLAVNEALASGMPVIVSDMVGCAPDLVSGSEGRVFPFADTAALASAMESIARCDHHTRARMGELGKRTIAWYSPALVAGRVASAVATVVSKRKRNPDD
jgi:glycosyltransferase involved in cell wall biosynthesis